MQSRLGSKAMNESFEHSRKLDHGGEPIARRRAAEQGGKADLRMPTRLSKSKMPNWKAQPQSNFSVAPGAKKPGEFSS